jgi:sulfur carrier protein ThiS
MRTSALRTAKRLKPACASNASRSARSVIRIGSTEWMRNGSMIVRNRSTQRTVASTALTRGAGCPTMSGVPQPAVTVDVRLGTRLGPGRRSIRLPVGATVADLIAALAPDLGRSPDELAGVAVALHGEVVGRERVLRDGEALALILPVAGG